MAAENPETNFLIDEEAYALLQKELAELQKSQPDLLSTSTPSTIGRTARTPNRRARSKGKLQLLPQRRYVLTPPAARATPGQTASEVGGGRKEKEKEEEVEANFR